MLIFGEAPFARMQDCKLCLSFFSFARHSGNGFALNKGSRRRKREFDSLNTTLIY